MFIVILAESDADVRKIISYALRSYADDIVTVHDAHEALAALDDLTPTLFFLDLNFPQMAASGLLDRLNDQLDSSSLRVIVTTAYSLRDVSDNLHPACAILRKPFDVATLRAAIEEQLARA
jgi:CheY-like chemotaxis protein